MRLTLVIGLCCLIILLSFTGVAAADSRAGGTIIVDEGETVNGLSATGGTVIIRGTVDGDLRVYGGDIRIAESGEVTGIVRAYGGTVKIDGIIGENALAYAGSVTLGETAEVSQSFGAVAGTVTIAGAVGGDANVFAGTITLAQTAIVQENLIYEGSLIDKGGTVNQATQQARELALVPPLGPLYIIFTALMFLADLLLGILLLYTGPQFATTAVKTATTEPLQTAGAGGVGCLTVGSLSVLFIITIVGIPLAIGLGLLGLVFAWVATVYGRYIVGEWLLGFVNVNNRYLALFVGVSLVALLRLIPFVGPVVRVGVFLLGAGIVVLAARRLYDLGTQSRGGLTNI